MSKATNKARKPFIIVEGKTRYLYHQKSAPDFLENKLKFGRVQEQRMTVVDFYSMLG